MLRWSRAFALVALLALAGSGCTWPMFGYDVGHTRFNPTNTRINTSNVGSLVLKGTAHTVGVVDSSPAMATVNSGGHVTIMVFVGSTSQGKLYAFDAGGVHGCSSATPTTCTPLWTATPAGGVVSSPAVANGVVYVGSFDREFYAFDAAGNTNCSGTPKTCNPLWTASTGSFVQSSPTVANGVVYVGSDDEKLYAFDAAGNTNCSGTPKTCNPLWTATTGALAGGPVESSPAIANGVVYVGSGAENLYAFDATGNTNCSGTPKTCHPLWTGITGGEVESSPAIANGVVYVGSGFGLYAFDATGNTNCSGTPRTCNPLWTGTTGGAVESSPAIAVGVVYVGSADNNLYAFGLP